MSQMKDFLAPKFFAGLKNKPYAWGKVFEHQQGAVLEQYTKTFNFDTKLSHHNEVRTPKKGPVKTIKRSVFWWVGEHKKEMVAFLSASSKPNGFSLSRRDRYGNTFMCFAVLVTHTHVLSTNIATVQMHICLVQTNTQAQTSLPLDFGEMNSTKVHLPKWHPAMQYYVK
jgi:hypothetical protein